MQRGESTIQELARKRWRMAIALSALMIAIYFGFILLIAFSKPLASRLLAPGLSVGIVLGALVIVLTWATTFFYIRWANRHVDSAIARLKAESTR